MSQVNTAGTRNQYNPPVTKSTGSNVNVIKNNKPQSQPPASKPNQAVSLNPQDKATQKNLASDSLTKQITFNSKPTQKPTSKPTSSKNQGNKLIDQANSVVGRTGQGTAVYGAITMAQNPLARTAARAANAARIVGVSSAIAHAASDSRLAKGALNVANRAAVAANNVAKTVKTTSGVIAKANIATANVQSKVLRAAGNTLKATGLSGSANVTRNAAAAALNTARASRAVAATANTTSLVARGAGVVGRVAPGVGFVAGMAGAGLAARDAANATTTAGRVAHGTRAVLGAVSGVASLVPGAGTAVSILATGADMGISYLAERRGWK